MKRFVIAKYIRLSLEDSKYESLSIPNQRLLLNRHIDSLNLDDAEVLEFVDNGYTGTNFERPGVQELLDLVRESKIDCIVVKDFSRFGRNIIETGYFIERVFPIFRTRFISVSDGFDSADYKEDTGGMEVAFKFLMHEYYSQDLSRKEKTAKYAKFKRGEYQSKLCPYGYLKGANGRMEIDPEAAETVKLIFESALTMANAADVVKVLYERKIPTPAEYKRSKGIGAHDLSRSIGIWSRSTVLRILEDERFTGMYIMGKRAVTEVGGHKIRMKDESEWFKIPDHHPAIVSKELYEQVKSRIRRFKCPKTERTYTLRAKVFCGCCRHAMQITPRKVRAFMCRYTNVDKSAECHHLEIVEQELENLLFKAISKQAQVIMNIDRLDASSKLTLHAEQQAEYKKKIEKLQDEKSMLYERYVLNELDVADYKSGKVGIDAELAQLMRILEKLNSEAAACSAAKSLDDELRDVAEKALAENKLSRPLVDLLVEKVYVYPGNQIEIEWKYADFFEDRKSVV